MSEGQDNEKTKEFSPEELEKFEKGLLPDTSEKPEKIEEEEVPLADLLDPDKPIFKEDQTTPPTNYDSPAKDPRKVKINPRAEQRTVTFKKPKDTERHTITRIGKEKYETSVWKLGDVRESKPVIFHGYEGLPWAIAKLVRETNSAINQGNIDGKTIKEGDRIQACIVSYYDGEVHKPRTTPDSPKYSTFPYKVINEGGIITTKLAIPEETKIHFILPEVVGDIIPLPDDLKEEDIRTYKREVVVTLQLKEAAHLSNGKTNLEEIAQQQSTVKYESSIATKEAQGFLEFLKQSEPEKQVTPNVENLKARLKGIFTEYRM